MIRTPQLISDQHQLFLSLSPNDLTCKLFLSLCEKMEINSIIQSRDMRGEYSGLTLLHEAARYGLLDAIHYLLTIGHAINPIDTSISRVIPLMEAIMYGHIEIVGVLLRCGASISYQDSRGENAFHYAARNGARMVKCLVKYCNLSKEMIQHLVSVTNVKLKFPEDIAANALTKEILVDLRERGYHLPYNRNNRNKDKIKK